MINPNEPSTGNVPLDPDLFNPEVVGTTRNSHQSPSSSSSSLLLGDPNQDFYPPSQEVWDLDPNDFDYETEDESDDQQDQQRPSTTRSIFTRLTNSIDPIQGNTSSQHDRPSSREEEPVDEDEDQDDDRADESTDDDQSDREPDAGDLHRLIGAIHGRHWNQESGNQGVLAEEWDRSMDQELNELKEAEDAIKPGRRVGSVSL